MAGQLCVRWKEVCISGYDHFPSSCLLGGSITSPAMMATDVPSHCWMFSEGRASPSEIFPEQDQFLWLPVGRGHLLLQPFAGSPNWRQGHVCILLYPLEWSRSLYSVWKTCPYPITLLSMSQQTLLPRSPVELMFFPLYPSSWDSSSHSGSMFPIPIGNNSCAISRRAKVSVRKTQMSRFLDMEICLWKGLNQTLKHRWLL